MIKLIASMMAVVVIAFPLLIGPADAADLTGPTWVCSYKLKGETTPKFSTVIPKDGDPVRACTEAAKRIHGDALDGSCYDCKMLPLSSANVEWECNGWVWCSNIKPVAGDPSEVRREYYGARVPRASSETGAANYVIAYHGRYVREKFPDSVWSCDGTLRCKTAN